jgi:hypothetical protein
MKKPFITSIILLAFISLTCVHAQNVVYETIFIKPKADKLKELGENMKAHNDKFHADAPYSANAWQVLSGEHSGQILWVMGPFTFADLDNRPSEGGHDDDWMGNVMPHTYGMNDGNYWRMIPDYGYMPSENYQGKVMRARLFDIKPGKWDEFMHLMMLIQKVYAANSFGHSFALFGNWSNDGKRDAAIVWQYDNYAYFDVELEFSKKYEEVHGDNSWNQFMEAVLEIVVSTQDELYEVMD